MNDDELVERLRATLRSRGAGLRPSPGRLPHGPHIVRPAPRTERRWAGRSRWIPAAAVLSGVIAAGVVAAVLVSGTGKATTKTQQDGPITSPNSVQPSPRTPATTLPGKPLTPVPNGFKALSTTWVSANDGWVLGLVPCGQESCTDLAATTNGGASWGLVNAPRIELSSIDDAPGLQVRFADPTDGWIYYTSSTYRGFAESPSTPNAYTSSTSGFVLWSTHDGGATWAGVANPAGPNATIADLEAVNDKVQLATVAGQGASGYTTPAGQDAWVDDGTITSVGAGSKPTASLTLIGNDAWMLVNNRTIASGQKLIAGSGWKAWTPPCTDGYAADLLTASTPDDLFAVCNEGVWGTPGSGTTSDSSWLFTSTDGGNNWTSIGPVTYGNGQAVAVTASPAGTLVVDTGPALMRSTDGGRSWHLVLGSPEILGSPESTATGDQSNQIDYVGFTTDSQAVAVSSGGTVYLSRDSGGSWSRVTF